MSAFADVLASGAQILTAAGIESAKLDARVLLAHVLNKKTGELIGRGEISSEDRARFDSLIARRFAREPVAYIIGHKEFWSIDFEVGPGVLVPRPETETLIEQALLEFPDRTASLQAIDLGIGSGCILLSFLTEYPKATGIGIERSPAALDYARHNSARIAPCELVEGDWSMAPGGPFNVVFSNPPYLAQAELTTAFPELSVEPEGALVGGADGLSAYRMLAPLIARRLRPEGRAFLEIGSSQAEAVTGILASAGLETVRVAPDLSGAPRCIVARPQKTVGMRGLSL